MFFCLAISILTCICHPGCAQTAKGTFLEEQASENQAMSGTSKYVDAENAINGAMFRSVKKWESGLSLNGVVLGYWTIKFDNGMYSWVYSDVESTGSYSCKGWNIIVAGSSQSKIHAEYNPHENLLIWDGKKYKRIEE
ncbi:MAG: hypothetical protein K8F52_12670 [Candidatus Scalindua rubra]|uniref:Uncharacterized protein n=1 Tax=Candidatus Scalindua brodae TaxID=237368 RepID=A0A0B0EGZ0_9BACT|nr:MAG: hypothetical protein SCABRO_03006 [Candidatus Scalindua brodae]MBZ0109512.1 hypothetical protein [Candidatus Scalindua rubra]TWU36927.1 hypothetical protein S225a_04240 [Candidatus Brocadiaceae bacterium S225]